MKKFLILLLALTVGAMGVILVLLLPREIVSATVPETAAVTEATAAPTLPQTLPTEIPETQPQSQDTISVYYQTDYPYARYGDGTIGSSGCGMACLAMAASFVTGREYTPEMLAWEFGGYGENNLQRLDYAIGQMQLPCEKNTDWRLTKQALQEGKIAIILVDERSEFTTSTHFILLAGINDGGRYEVIDPFEPNYREEYLAEGFEKGFTEEQILAGLEGSWVFDREQMGSFYYNIVMPQAMPTRYGNFRPTDKDVDFLARFVWAAAREEDPQTKQAVAELVLNRMAAEKYPDRVEDVMAQEELHVWYKQLGRAELTVEHYAAVTGALYGPYILPIDVVHGAPWPVGGGEEWGKLGSFAFSYEKLR